MAFNFEAAANRSKRQRPKARQKASEADPANLSDSDREYRDRAKAEAERRKLATDGDCFSCLSFRSREEMDKAVRRLDVKLVSGRYTFDEDFRAALDAAGFVCPKMSFRQPQRIVTGKFANPCEGIERTGDAEADIMAQFMALFDAMKSRQNEETYKYVYDSPYWFSIIFRSSEDRDRFLRETGFIRYGDAYLDGSAVLRKVFPE